MINYTLLKQGLKTNYKIFLIFLAILTLYIVSIVSMYDPKLSGMLIEFSKSMPEMMAIFGMDGTVTTLIGYLITYLYGFLFMILPMVVIIIIANKLVASHTDKGSMAYLLAAPNNRFKIIFTQMKVLAIFITSLIVYITIMTIISTQIMFPGELDINKILLLNFCLLIFHFAISGICFLASVICNDTKNSLLIGAGVPVFFFVIQMLVNAGEKMAIFKYFTIFSLFDPKKIVNYDTTSLVLVGCLALITFALYFTAIKIFQKRNLSV